MQPIPMEFLADFPGRGPFLAFIVLAPGLVAWWSGRALTRNAEDPLIAERLLAARHRARLALVISWVVISIVASNQARWLVPLMIVCRALAAYPRRRALHGETWSPIEYLWFFCRFTAAFLGFWLLLMYAPLLTLAAGRADWFAAAAVGTLLLLWDYRAPDVVRALMRTKPIADPELVDRLADLSQRARVPAPRFEIVPMGGGVLPNAVALPSRRGSTVLMTSTFAERFDRDEIVAVCAHEIAHIEHFSGARMKRLRLATFGLVLGSVMIAPFAKALMPGAEAWAFLSWVVFVFSVQAIRARNRQKNETASDVRAVELTGDGEALVRALTKLHVMARVPRRWDARFERNATHPSLARRIKAIRDAAGRTSATLQNSETFASGSIGLTLDHDRLHWTDSGLMQSVSYARLTELRLDVPRGKPACLIAVDRTGQRWTFAIDPPDIPRLQHALDVVDVHLGETPAPPTISAVAVRVVAAMTASVALSAFHLATLLPLTLLIARPSAALAAGAAAAALASALVVWRDGLTIIAGWMWWAGTLGICSAALMALAWVGRKDEAPEPIGKPLAILALGTVFTWGLLFLSGTSAVRLHQSAQASPSAIVLPAALAGALAWSRRRSIRRAATPLALIAALIFALGSRTYVESFGRDRFLAQGPARQLEALAPRTLSHVDLPERDALAAIRLSPNGARVALGSDDEDNERRVFYVGSISGPFELIECDDALFVDDSRLITIEHLRDAVMVRDMMIVPEPSTIRERRLEHVRAGRLTINRSARTWTVLGYAAGDEIVRIEGPLDAEGQEIETRWPNSPGDARNGWVQAIAASSDHVLMRRSRYHAGALGTGYLMALAYSFAPSWIESDFWIVGRDGTRPLGTSGLTVDCHSKQDAGGNPACAAFDGTHTTLFTLDLATGRLDARATLRGRLFGSEDDGSGWWTGHIDGATVAIRADGERAWRIESDRNAWIRGLAINGGKAAAIVSDASSASLTTFVVPE
jgi:Zn-dependent protease with chaperone function